MDSSDTDDDLGLIPESDFSDESDEAKRINSDKIGVIEYEFLTTSDLIYKMKNDVANISTVLQVNESIAKSLLNKFEWNVEQLVNHYYDATDLTAFFQSLNIADPRSGATASAVEPLTQCDICFTPVAKVTKMKTFHCGHQFCESCCSEYFKTKVLNDGVGNDIKCPDFHCNESIDDTTVIKLIPGDVVQKLLTFISRAFVASNPLLRHCRACEYTIKANVLESVRIICQCGFESYLQCNEIWHDGITCELLKKWIRICIDDVENEKWLKENTKKCPHCTFNIEKDGGCNHMHCTSCDYHFCWICRNEWHEDTTCNNFKNDDISARLLHFSARYVNHTKSLKLEHGIYDEVVRVMPFLSAKELADASSPDVVLLQRAVKTLKRSRQTLITTYVFAYYTMHCIQLEIFERNQSDLEHATENLSWLLERGISVERWVDVKQKLKESSTYCHRRRHVLLEHVIEGYENQYWNFRDD